jgi:hypothetical protein
MPSPATCRLASPDEQIAAQRAVIARFEAALWDGGFNEALLPSYQSAWRRLETLIAARGDDRRHAFMLVIPVADSPQQLRACLASLVELGNLYGYGGQRDGCWQKVSVMIADDSEDPSCVAAHRAIAREFQACGLAVHVFGLEEQRTLLAALPDAQALARIIGTPHSAAAGHKGQGSMRNIAWLKLAQMLAADDATLVYTLDADQTFRVKIATPDGGREAYAVNFLAALDAVFGATDAEVLTGKVVGDPPVSPAVMAGNFLDDVTAFLREMAASAPDVLYPQPAAGAQGSGEAAYHDMAGLFGFHQANAAWRYVCPLDGTPSNADCFDAFSRRLSRFFHGEHPTRVTWYCQGDLMQSVQAARTVYTGNAVYRASALRWFIPFAPLRLRMSGPTLGRLLKAELGERFVSANLPMLHTRTVDATGTAEFRPGVVASEAAVDLGDEFERQFHGDVMLFTVERLAEQGFPRHPMEAGRITATLDAVQAEMLDRYHARQAALRERLAQLQSLLNASDAWWNRSDALAGARARFGSFAASLAHNFGDASPGHARIDSAHRRAAWRQRQVEAIAHVHADRHAWDAALAALRRLRPGSGQA